eukprot:1150962-Pelagomonas_calceolata.AAC.1
MHKRRKLGSADTSGYWLLVIAGRGETMPHSPLPQTPLSVWKLISQQISPVPQLGDTFIQA